MQYQKTFAQNLATLRKNAGISQKALASILGISDAAVNMLEKEKRLPSFEILLALADYFNVSLDYLVGRSDDPTRH